MTAPGLADVEAAARTLRGVVTELPLMPVRFLADLVGGPVLLVPENLQRAGSFKIRGAYVRLSRLTESERRSGVVAASAGNHAQGVALAAQLLGIRSTVFMPHGASIPKVQATKGYGAEVRFAGQSVDEAVLAAREYADETASVFIHPFDHPDVIAGQGTVGLDILRQLPDVRTILVSTGGGGLLAGIALATQHAGVRVVGVQAEGAASYPASLAAGHPVALSTMSTMADGIAVARPGDLPFAIVRNLGLQVRTVSESAISTAVLALLERTKLLAEPAGAAAAAALLADPTGFEPPVAVVVSGGNVDPLLLLRIVRHGLAAAGRYLAFTVRMPDRPGTLARLLTDIQVLDVNVVDIEHNRLDPSLAVGEVSVRLHVETPSAEYGQALLAAISAKGYQLAVG